MTLMGPSISSNNRCVFRVWAPDKNEMQLHLVYPVEKILEMHKADGGYFELELEGIEQGTRYFYRPEHESSLPDPASHYQPEGVHGPSEVVNHDLFEWTDNDWKGIPFNQ